MRATSTVFFAGLPADDQTRVLDRFQRRRYPAGTTVIAEGEARGEVLVVGTGVADVFVADRDGREHRVNRCGPDSTLGEMAFLTGQPASATVRAGTDLDVVVLSHDDVHRVAAEFPVVYRNVAAIVAERLARTTRRALRGEPGRVATLLDGGAPPLLGYALACSVAWHARAATLLIVLTDGAPPAALAAHCMHERHARGVVSTVAPRAQVMIVPPTGAFAPDAVSDTIRDVRSRFAHVLVQVAAHDRAPSPGGSIYHLVGPTGSPRDDGTARRRTIRGWTDAGGALRPDAAGVLAVPPLGPDEERALHDGLLSTTGAAGRAIGWMARDLARLKVGLALGGGSVRGYAHLGVLRGLARAGVGFDYLAGTSVGAAVATLTATDHGPDEAADLLDRVGGAAFRPTVSTTSLLSSAGLRAGIRELAGDTRFEELPLPLAITAADLVTRQEVVFRHGPLWPAVLASMSIPGIYPPQRVGDQVLVDGAVLNPVPSGPAAAMGADVVIGVKLAYRPESAPAVPTKPPRLLDVMTTTLDMMQTYITADTANAADVVIEPDLTDTGGFGLRHFSRGRRFIADGEAAVEAALPRLAAVLPWLRA